MSETDNALELLYNDILSLFRQRGVGSQSSNSGQGSGSAPATTNITNVTQPGLSAQQLQSLISALTQAVKEGYMQGELALTNTTQVPLNAYLRPSSVVNVSTTLPPLNAPTISLNESQRVDLFQVSLLPILPSGVTIQYFATLGKITIPPGGGPSNLAGLGSIQNFAFPRRSFLAFGSNVPLNIYAVASGSGAQLQAVLIGKYA